jgi:hypothetical protein
VILEIKGTYYVAHVVRVLKCKPFVPTQFTHLARLAHQVLANSQQLVASSSVEQLNSAPLDAR